MGDCTGGKEHGDFHYRRTHKIRDNKDGKGNVISSTYAYVKVCGKCGRELDMTERTK